MSGFVSGGTLSGQPGGGGMTYDAYGNRIDGASGTTVPTGTWVPNNPSTGSTGTDMMNKAYSGFQQYLGMWALFSKLSGCIIVVM